MEWQKAMGLYKCQAGKAFWIIQWWINQFLLYNTEHKFGT
jgi:hypothetical protein